VASVNEVIIQGYLSDNHLKSLGTPMLF